MILESILQMLHRVPGVLKASCIYPGLCRVCQDRASDGSRQILYWQRVILDLDKIRHPDTHISTSCSPGSDDNMDPWLKTLEQSYLMNDQPTFQLEDSVLHTFRTEYSWGHRSTGEHYSMVKRIQMSAGGKIPYHIMRRATFHQQQQTQYRGPMLTT